MTVLKMERSDDIHTLLVLDDVYGGTVFFVFDGETDEGLVEEFINDDFGKYSHNETYSTYKTKATDWRTIYEA